MIEGLFSGHAFGKYFALNDFMRWLTAVHFETGKFLVALWAGHIAVCVVFGNAFYNAFDQTAVPAFVIFVKEGFAFGTKDGNGANVFAGHKLCRILSARCGL